MLRKTNHPVVDITVVRQSLVAWLEKEVPEPVTVVVDPSKQSTDYAVLTAQTASAREIVREKIEQFLYRHPKIPRQNIIKNSSRHPGNHGHCLHLCRDQVGLLINQTLTCTDDSILHHFLHFLPWDTSLGLRLPANTLGSILVQVLDTAPNGADAHWKDKEKIRRLVAQLNQYLPEPIKSKLKKKQPLFFGYTNDTISLIAVFNVKLYEEYVSYMRPKYLLETRNYSYKAHETRDTPYPRLLEENRDQIVFYDLLAKFTLARPPSEDELNVLTDLRFEEYEPGLFQAAVPLGMKSKLVDFVKRIEKYFREYSTMRKPPSAIETRFGEESHYIIFTAATHQEWLQILFRKLCQFEKQSRLDQSLSERFQVTVPDRSAAPPSMQSMTDELSVQLSLTKTEVDAMRSWEKAAGHRYVKIFCETQERLDELLQCIHQKLSDSMIFENQCVVSGPKESKKWLRVTGRQAGILIGENISARTSVREKITHHFMHLQPSGFKTAEGDDILVQFVDFCGIDQEHFKCFWPDAPKGETLSTSLSALVNMLNRANNGLSSSSLAGREPLFHGRHMELEDLLIIYTLHPERYHLFVEKYSEKHRAQFTSHRFEDTPYQALWQENRSRLRAQLFSSCRFRESQTTIIPETQPVAPPAYARLFSPAIVKWIRLGCGAHQSNKEIALPSLDKLHTMCRELAECLMIQRAFTQEQLYQLLKEHLPDMSAQTLLFDHDESDIKLSAGDRPIPIELFHGSENRLLTHREKKLLSQVFCVLSTLLAESAEAHVARRHRKADTEDNAPHKQPRVTEVAETLFGSAHSPSAHPHSQSATSSPNALT